MATRQRAELRMLPSTDAPAHARRWVRETLDDSTLSVDAVNDAVLMIDELVTNAVVHAGTPIVVVLEPTPSGYRCEVVDQRVDGPRPRLVAVSAGAGRGLRFVDFMATAWGVDRSARDTTVWVEVTVGE